MYGWPSAFHGHAPRALLRLLPPPCKKMWPHNLLYVLSRQPPFHRGFNEMRVLVWRPGLHPVARVGPGIQRCLPAPAHWGHVRLIRGSGDGTHTGVLGCIQALWRPHGSVRLNPTHINAWGRDIYFHAGISTFRYLRTLSVFAAPASVRRNTSVPP